VEGERPLAVAEVLGAYGVGGAVWVRPLTGARDRARTLSEVLLLRDDVSRPARVGSAREVEGRWLVTFEGVSTREEAQRLRGFLVAVAPSSSPPLPEGEWYVRELVGREVRTDAGGSLGTVSDVIRTGANDCWEIQGPEGELLFPALRDLVISIPKGTGPITVRVPPGLLEACLTRRKPA